jgi:hypothetical protein
VRVKKSKTLETSARDFLGFFSFSELRDIDLARRQTINDPVLAQLVMRIALLRSVIGTRKSH